MAQSYHLFTLLTVTSSVQYSKPDYLMMVSSSGKTQVTDDTSVYHFMEHHVDLYLQLHHHSSFAVACTDV